MAGALKFLLTPLGRKEKRWKMNNKGLTDPGDLDTVALRSTGTSGLFLISLSRQAKLRRTELS